MQRRQFIQSAIGTIATLPAWQPARADAWPSRPVRIIVPFTPGGTTDVVTRLVGNELGKSLGQSVIVENKPGAGTVIGVDTVAKAVPDGYTFGTIANSFTANKTLVKNLPYDSAMDLRPVALMGLSEHVLTTHPASELKTLADLKKAALTKPGTLSYASFGNGTSAHLSGALLCQILGIDMVHVPYKGQGPAMADLIGGQVTVMFGNWPEFRGQIASGKLTALGMATLQRSQFAPDVPTLAEQGAALESNSWQGLLAPARTSDAIVQRLNQDVNRALASAAVVKTFHEGGIVSKAGSVEQFAAFIRSEEEKYARIIRAANISVG